MSEPSGLQEHDDEQPQSQPQPQHERQAELRPQTLPERRRQRRLALALVSAGLVVVAGIVVTVMVVNNNSSAVSNDPGCKEFASQLASFDPVPPTSSTDYTAFSNYYSGYGFPAEYALSAAQNDQLSKDLLALKNASDTMDSDATQDEEIGGGSPVPQSKINADTLTFNQALAAVNHICNLS